MGKPNDSTGFCPVQLSSSLLTLSSPDHCLIHNLTGQTDWSNLTPATLIQVRDKMHWWLVTDQIVPLCKGQAFDTWKTWKPYCLRTYGTHYVWFSQNNYADHHTSPHMSFRWKRSLKTWSKPYLHYMITKKKSNKKQAFRHPNQEKDFIFFFRRHGFASPYRKEKYKVNIWINTSKI